MALGDIVTLDRIPHFDLSDIGGRFICTLSFYDKDKWRCWFPVEGPSQRFVEAQAWPAEDSYFGHAPELATDTHSYLLNLIAQRANFDENKLAFCGVQDDIFNLSAALAKVEMAHAAGKGLHGSSRLVATEIEFTLAVCRSLFDLLQEIIANLWATVKPIDEGLTIKPLKRAFSDMALANNQVRTVAEISERFGLPETIAQFYARHAPLFLQIRRFRDSLLHRGSRVQTIFRGDRGFLIRKTLGPFRDLDIWRDDEIEKNHLVPLLPALGMVIHGTLDACDDFARTIERCIILPEPTVPGMNLYLRGYFDQKLALALEDAQARLTDGRSLSHPRQPPAPAR